MADCWAILDGPSPLWIRNAVMEKELSARMAGAIDSLISMKERDGLQETLYLDEMSLRSGDEDIFRRYKEVSSLPADEIAKAIEDIAESPDITDDERSLLPKLAAAALEKDIHALDGFRESLGVPKNTAEQTNEDIVEERGYSVAEESAGSQTWDSVPEAGLSYSTGITKDGNRFCGTLMILRNGDFPPLEMWTAFGDTRQEAERSLTRLLGTKAGIAFSEDEISAGLAAAMNDSRLAESLRKYSENTRTQTQARKEKPEEAKKAQMNIGAELRSAMPQLAIAAIGTRDLHDMPEAEERFLSAIKALNGADMRHWGITLYSGHSDGADQAAENAYSGPVISFLPWDGFNGAHAGKEGRIEYAAYDTDPMAELSIRKAHPNPSVVSQGARKLLARDFLQISGPRSADGTFRHPAAAVICVTKDGKETGGTAEAMRIARMAGIPVYNMASEEDYERLCEDISSLRDGKMPEAMARAEEGFRNLEADWRNLLERMDAEKEAREPENAENKQEMDIPPDQEPDGTAPGWDMEKASPFVDTVDSAHDTSMWLQGRDEVPSDILTAGKYGLDIGTAYYAKLRDYENDPDTVCISISRSLPREMKNKGSFPVIEELQPTREILQEYKDADKSTPEKEWAAVLRYMERYRDEVLSKVDRKALLEKISSIANGRKNVILFCYEGPLRFCHRFMAAGFLTGRILTQEEEKAHGLSPIELQMPKISIEEKETEMTPDLFSDIPDTPAETEQKETEQESAPSVSPQEPESSGKTIEERGYSAAMDSMEPDEDGFIRGVSYGFDGLNAHAARYNTEAGRVFVGAITDPGAAELLADLQSAVDRNGIPLSFDTHSEKVNDYAKQPKDDDGRAMGSLSIGAKDNQLALGEKWLVVTELRTIEKGPAGEPYPKDLPPGLEEKWKTYSAGQNLIAITARGESGNGYAFLKTDHQRDKAAKSGEVLKESAKESYFRKLMDDGKKLLPAAYDSETRRFISGPAQPDGYRYAIPKDWLDEISDKGKRDNERAKKAPKRDNPVKLLRGYGRDDIPESVASCTIGRLGVFDLRGLDNDSLARWSKELTGTDNVLKRDIYIAAAIKGDDGESYRYAAVYDPQKMKHFAKALDGREVPISSREALEKSQENSRYSGKVAESRSSFMEQADDSKNGKRRYMAIFSGQVSPDLFSILGKGAWRLAEDGFVLAGTGTTIQERRMERGAGAMRTAHLAWKGAGRKESTDSLDPPALSDDRVYSPDTAYREEVKELLPDHGASYGNDPIAWKKAENILWTIKEERPAFIMIGGNGMPDSHGFDSLPLVRAAAEKYGIQIRDLSERRTLEAFRNYAGSFRKRRESRSERIDASPKMPSVWDKTEKAAEVTEHTAEKPEKITYWAAFGWNRLPDDIAAIAKTLGAMYGEEKGYVLRANADEGFAETVRNGNFGASNKAEIYLPRDKWKGLKGWYYSEKSDHGERNLVMRYSPKAKELDELGIAKEASRIQALTGSAGREQGPKTAFAVTWTPGGIENGVTENVSRALNIRTYNLGRKEEVQGLQKSIIRYIPDTNSYKADILQRLKTLEGTLKDRSEYEVEKPYMQDRDKAIAQNRREMRKAGKSSKGITD